MRGMSAGIGRENSRRRNSVRYLQLIAQTQKKVAEKSDNVSGFSATSSIRFLTVNAAVFTNRRSADG